jgi:hypothetical protein
MELHRLTPASCSGVKARYAGRCCECHKPVRHSETVVHLYGETFHHDCAFYRSSDVARREAPTGSA